MYKKTFIPDVSVGEYEGILVKGPGPADIEINLPLYNGVESFRIALEEKAYVGPPAEYRVKEPILFYGSSITQGGCASRPGNAYTSILCRWLGTDHINLGFSGAGCGEEIVAEYIGGLGLSAFVMDYDHNAPDVRHLERTHERFFRIIREANPALPIVIITKPDTDSGSDYKARRDVIYKTYENAKTAGDKNVCFINGETLFGLKDRDACTVDGVHPNDLGFMRMAENIMPVLEKALLTRFNKK